MAATSASAGAMGRQRQLLEGARALSAELRAIPPSAGPASAAALRKLIGLADAVRKLRDSAAEVN
jgi:hypothetical protein